MQNTINSCNTRDREGRGGLTSLVGCKLGTPAAGNDLSQLQIRAQRGHPMNYPHYAGISNHISKTAAWRPRGHDVHLVRAGKTRSPPREC